MSIHPSGAAVDHAEDRLTLRKLQKRRKLWLRGAVTLCALALLFVQSSWPDDGLVHESLETLGLLAIIACIAGRSWSILYIGGRKTNQLVSLGPYSVSRNPLYVFSFLGAFGIGLQSGSLTIGLVCLAIAAVIFVPVVQREEEVLARTFGAEFDAYRSRVPRFGPRLDVMARRRTRLVLAGPALSHGPRRPGLRLRLPAVRDRRAIARTPAGCRSFCVFPETSARRRLRRRRGPRPWCRSAPGRRDR